MLPVAHLSHSLPDRFRLHIAERKGDGAYFAAVETALAAYAPVTRVETNPLTASLLIYHNGAQADLLRFAAEQQLFQLAAEFPVQAQVLSAAGDQLDQADQMVRRLTQGAFDLQALLFVGLLGAAVIQLFRGRVLAPAATLLSYAATILMLQRSQRSSR